MPEDILFLSTNRFDPYLPLRKFWFSKFMSENGFRVVYVEFPHTFLAYLKRGLHPETEARLSRISDNYFVLRSFPILPFFKRNRLCNWIDSRLFYRHIKGALKGLDFKPSLIWSYVPFFPDALEAFHTKTLYDCVDDYVSLPGLIDPNYVLELERNTVNLVDKVIVTDTPYLEDRMRLFGKEPVVISNGVNYEVFSRWLSMADTLQIRKRIIYVGNVSHWFDLELFEKIADALEGFEIMIVGFASVDVSSFKKHPNINFVGKLMQEEFAQLLSESSVAIIPFIENELTKATDPLKVYEYLAAGVPVVSTCIGNVSRLPVYVTSRDNFVERIREAVKEDTIEKRRSQTLFAKQFSWETKYKMVEKILENLKAQNHPS